MDSTYLKLVDSITNQIIEKIGINNTAFHFEFRTTKETPIVLEVAARLGGGPIFRSILESTQINMMEVLYNIAIDNCNYFHELSKNSKVSIPVITLAFYSKPGRLIEIIGLEEILTHPFFKEAILYDKIGTIIKSPPNVSHCTMHIMLSGSSFENLEIEALSIIKKLKFITI